MNEIMELETKAVEINAQATSITIKNQATYDSANVFLRNIKALQAQVKDAFRPIIEQAHKAHKIAVAQEKEHLAPLEKAAALISSKMLAYWQEQERSRREAEAKLQAKAEKERQEALAKAEAARANGKETRAEKYEEKAASIIAPQLAPSIDKGGAIIKKLWSAEVYDLRALVTAIAAEKAPLSLIEPNMTAIHAQARAFKDTLNLPGVRAVCEDNLSIRS